MVGGTASFADSLIAVDTDLATEIARVKLPDSLSGFGAALDEAANRVFIGGFKDGAMVLLVYDAGTLALQGVLPAPDPCPYDASLGNCHDGAVVLDQPAHAAYLVEAAPGNEVKSWKFDLLP